MPLPRVVVPEPATVEDPYGGCRVGGAAAGGGEVVRKGRDPGLRPARLPHKAGLGDAVWTGPQAPEDRG